MFFHVAGAGFEPASSRLWASRAATALPRDVKGLVKLTYSNRVDYFILIVKRHYRT